MHTHNSCYLLLLYVNHYCNYILPKETQLQEFLTTPLVLGLKEGQMQHEEWFQHAQCTVSCWGSHTSWKLVYLEIFPEQFQHSYDLGLVIQACMPS